MNFFIYKSYKKLKMTKLKYLKEDYQEFLDLTRESGLPKSAIQLRDEEKFYNAIRDPAFELEMRKTSYDSGLAMLEVRLDILTNLCSNLKQILGAN
jgi:hypothetical protein